MGSLVISNSILEQAQISPAELRLEIAMYLMAKKRLNIEQACQLAGLDLSLFQKELAKHSVPVHKSESTGSATFHSGSQDAPHFLTDVVGSLTGPDGDELAEIVSREFQQIEGEW